MSDYSTYKSLLDYVEKATDLAECVKRNIVKAKDGVAVIDDRTVLALNKFRVAANAIADLPEQISKTMVKFN